jgi:hypothetical protein
MTPDSVHPGKAVAGEGRFGQRFSQGSRRLRLHMGRIGDEMKPGRNAGSLDVHEAVNCLHMAMHWHGSYRSSMVTCGCGPDHAATR